MTIGERFRYCFSAKRVWTLCTFLLSFIVLFAIDHVGETSGITENNPGAPWYQQVLSSGFWYEFAVTGGLRKPESSHVALVLIQEPGEVVSNVCSERFFLADLLQTLAADFNARVIVIDQWFSPGRCAEPKATQELQQVMAAVPAKVVYGRAALTADDLTHDEFEKLRKAGLQESDLILKDTLFQEAPPHLTEGLLQLNKDNRRIALGWYTYSNKDAVGIEPRQYRDTLAVAALRVNDPRDPFIAHLQDWISSGKDPFTSFLPARSAAPLASDGPAADTIPQYSGLELICLGSHNAHSWNCPDHSNLGLDRSTVDFGYRLVVVGTVDPEQDPDTHESVIGRVPGVVLWANYIESLLGRRYLKRVNPWVENIIALGWFLIIDLLFHMNHSRPIRAIIWSVVVNVLVWVILYNLIILELGYYISLSIPGFLMIASRYIWTLEARRDGTHATG
jgi:CHASE2 domain-containing sensor protein